MSRTLKIKTRYYRALPIDSPGYEEEEFELPLEKTALVGMHCWNIGCADGPAADVNFCVGMGWPQATAEAGRIMAEVIRPAMETPQSFAERLSTRYALHLFEWKIGYGTTSTEFMQAIREV